jgi:probable F420-dependent oxidoreductase
MALTFDEMPVPAGEPRPSPGVAKPFEFLADAQSITSGRELAALAKRAEAAGYYALTLPDHLLKQLGPITAFSWILAATDRLHVSPFVFNNDLRHPAVLAQELASLDVLSGGRLDIAFGAGWNEAEYKAIGLRFDPAPTRQARLVESIAVLKGAFGPGPFSFAGEQYRITELDAYPKPVSVPHPRLMVAGGGRRTLELAAREADVVGFAPQHSPKGPVRDAFTLEGTWKQLAWVRAAAGDRFDDLVLNTYPAMAGKVSVDPNARTEARGLLDRLRNRWGIELTEEELLGSAHYFAGSLPELEEKFQVLRTELGFSSFYVGEVGPLDSIVAKLAGQ